MSAPLGSLQSRLLEALRRHGRPSTLQALVALAAGITTDLAARPPSDWVPTRATYTATGRAVSGLRRRGLVTTWVVGTTKGRMEWHVGGHSVWRFKNPSTRLMVSLVVDSLRMES